MFINQHVNQYSHNRHKDANSHKLELDGLLSSVSSLSYRVEVSGVLNSETRKSAVFGQNPWFLAKICDFYGIHDFLLKICGF